MSFHGALTNPLILGLLTLILAAILISRFTEGGGGGGGGGNGSQRVEVDVDDGQVDVGSGSVDVGDGTVNVEGGGGSGNGRSSGGENNVDVDIDQQFLEQLLQQMQEIQQEQERMGAWGQPPPAWSQWMAMMGGNMNVNQNRVFPGGERGASVDRGLFEQFIQVLQQVDIDQNAIMEMVEVLMEQQGGLSDETIQELIEVLEAGDQLRIEIDQDLHIQYVENLVQQSQLNQQNQAILMAIFKGSIYRAPGGIVNIIPPGDFPPVEVDEEVIQALIDYIEQMNQPQIQQFIQQIVQYIQQNQVTVINQQVLIAIEEIAVEIVEGGDGGGGGSPYDGTPRTGGGGSGGGGGPGSGPGDSGPYDGTPGTGAGSGGGSRGSNINGGPRSSSMADDPLRALEADLQEFIEELEREKKREVEIEQHTESEIQELQQILGRLKELEPYLEPIIQMELNSSPKGESIMREWDAVRERIEENAGESVDSVEMFRNIQESLNNIEQEMADVIEDIKDKEQLTEQEVELEQDIDSKIETAEGLLNAVEEANEQAQRLMS